MSIHAVIADLLEVSIALDRASRNIIDERDALPRGSKLRPEYRAVINALQPLRKSMPGWVEHMKGFEK